jgi:hypothetical protein
MEYKASGYTLIYCRYSYEYESGHLQEIFILFSFQTFSIRSQFFSLLLFHGLQFRFQGAINIILMKRGHDDSIMILK